MLWRIGGSGLRWMERFEAFRARAIHVPLMSIARADPATSPLRTPLISWLELISRRLLAAADSAAQDNAIARGRRPPCDAHAVNQCR